MDPVLVVSPVEPTSRDTGMLIPIAEMVETLASRARVDLVTFTDDDDKAGEVRAEWGNVIRLPKRSKARYCAGPEGWRDVKSGGLPRAVYPYAHRRAKAAVHGMLALENYSRVLCYLGLVAGLVPSTANVPRFLVVQDVLYHVVSLNARYRADPLSRTVSGREVDRMREYERRAYGQFDACSVVSHAEADRLAPLLGGRSKINVIPNGVAIGPDAPDPDDSPPPRGRLVYVGALDSKRNMEGVEWLLTEVLPLVRREVEDVTVDIVGRAPPPKLVTEIRQLNGVRVTGRVSSTADYLGQDAIFVSTNRVGSGIRNGVLEAMGAGLPCVATTASLGGVDGVAGQDYICRDDATGFASDVVRLLRSPSLAARIGRSGQRCVRRGYSWGAYREGVLSMMNLL